ncbi:hypothetical protein AMTRI_Chr11g154510 [Amborella trichopoda]
MAFLASISMICILNMTSCHVNLPLLEAHAKRFNYQTNTFFLHTGETKPTLEEIARVSGLSLVEIVYQPSTATDNHSIKGAQLLRAAYSSHGQWVNMEVLVWNRGRSRATKQIHIFLFVSKDSSKFFCSFSTCLLGASGLHHCFCRVGEH